MSFIHLKKSIPNILKKRNIYTTLTRMNSCDIIKKVIQEITKQNIEKIIYKNNSLIIHTNNSLISHEIRLQEDIILEKLKEKNIYIQKIRYIIS